MLTKKIGVALVPIIYPGSPPIPGLEGKQGIPSPNRNISSNNRGGTNSDFVSKAPSIKANEGLRVSSLPTEEKDLEFSMDKLSFSMGELGMAVAPLVSGAALGYMTADDEDQLRNAVIGGIAGGLLGVGGVAASRHFAPVASAVKKVITPSEIATLAQKAGINRLDDIATKDIQGLIDAMKMPVATGNMGNFLRDEKILEYSGKIEDKFGAQVLDDLTALITEMLKSAV